MLFTFPSRYSSTIGHRNVFSLGRWSCQLQPGFLVSRPTQEQSPDGRLNFAYGALTLYGGAFQRASTHSNLPSEEPAGPSDPALQPRVDNGCSLSRLRSLGSSPFARRYSGNHSCFLFLRVLRCFSSPGSPRSRGPRVRPRGFSHWGTPHSMALSASCGNFAALHAPRRLWKPRHPLRALFCMSEPPRTFQCMEL